MVLIIWVISIFFTVFIALNKKRNGVGWFILSLLFGPIAAMVVLILPKIEESRIETPVQYKDLSLSSIKFEIEDLKREFNMLGTRLSSLAEKINNLEPKVVQRETEELLRHESEQVFISEQEPQSMPEGSERNPKPKAMGADIEINLGKFWLNKIGMVVFSLGIAFLLTYTLAHIGPAAKIMFGYLIAAVLFISGIKLERIRKFINYGRVLLGGGWAIIYFTTYAMYHFEASKIINSQFLDLMFLIIVAFGIIVHALRYKSETLAAVTLFIGYFTSVLGDVNYFTLISSALLGIVALVMVYKMQWIKFIFFGIILTYATHFVWVVKQISFSMVVAGHLSIENVYFLLDAGFLLIYWLLFNAAIHLIKDNGSEHLRKNIAAANFLNFILFFFLTYPKFYFFYPAYKFNAIFGFGLAYMVMAAIMDMYKRSELFISDIIIGISLLTLSVPLKFLPYHATIIWFIELPFLLFIGFIFERKVYRYLGFALSFILFLKLLFSNWALLGNLNILSVVISWQAFLSFIGFISTAVCFCLSRFYRIKKVYFVYEQTIQNLYSGFSLIYLSIYISEVIKSPWLTLAFSFESLLIFTIGALLMDRYIRCYALAILSLAGIRFCFLDRYQNVKELAQLFLVYGPVFCAFAEYLIYRKLNRKSLISKPEVLLAKFLFFIAVSLLVFAIVVYVQQIWITLSLALVAILGLLWGVRISDRYIRIYSLLILIFAALRFSFIDTYSVNKILQWALICGKLFLVFSSYFIYRALGRKSRIDESERTLINPLFYGCLLLVVLSIFKYITDIWVTVSLGLIGGILFAVGFLIKDKAFRHGGFILFGITLVRIVFVDLAELAIIYKIISFIILGIIFLGVSFVYTNDSSKQKA